jgi:hypothetical protein
VKTIVELKAFVNFYADLCDLPLRLIRKSSDGIGCYVYGLNREQTFLYLADFNDNPSIVLAQLCNAFGRNPPRIVRVF